MNQNNEIFDLNGTSFYCNNDYGIYQNAYKQSPVSQSSVSYSSADIDTSIYSLDESSNSNSTAYNNYYSNWYNNYYNYNNYYSSSPNLNCNYGNYYNYANVSLNNQVNNSVNNSSMEINSPTFPANQPIHLKSKVNSIDDTTNQISTKKTNVRKHQLPDKAIDILNEWFDDHLNNPYPTLEQKEKLAKLGGVTVKQVNAWFSNRRNRSQNTKPKRMKRAIENEFNNIVNVLSSGRSDKHLIIENFKKNFNY